jgi:5-methylcytosine-specific restriction endonuclease McrA
MNYSEQLNDPRWKKKRVDILRRDKHSCQMCGYFGPKVNVHHKKYTGMAWEAPDEDLITLCKGCHRTTHKPELNDKKFENMKLSNIIKKNYG